MAIEKWDEESVNALFRQYQRRRDGVSYERYHPIIEAARGIAESRAGTDIDAETAHRMSMIEDAARKQFTQQDRSQVVDWSSAADRSKISWLDGLRRDAQEFFESLNPARWVPVAVTAALLVVVVPFVLDTTDTRPGNELVASNLQTLQSNSAEVAKALQELSGFQMGFSSSGSDFAAAFSAGGLFVDLVSLTGSQQTEQIEEIEAALKSALGDRLQFEQVVEQDQISRTAKLGDQLQQYYSKDPYSSVFILGQWVESSYLLGKVSQQSGTTETIHKSLKEVDDIIGLLESSGHNTAMLNNDLLALKALSTATELNRQDATKATLVLLKMRSYLAGM